MMPSLPSVSVWKTPSLELEAAFHVRRTPTLTR
jgi:hypothetical protein